MTDLRTSARKENAMKKRKPLRGGRIEAPKDTTKDQPKGSVLRGKGDLRDKK